MLKNNINSIDIFFSATGFNFLAYEDNYFVNSNSVLPACKYLPRSNPYKNNVGHISHNVFTLCEKV